MYAIGHWKDEDHLHGYAKTILFHKVTEGYWENSNIFANIPKDKDKITQYDPDNDICSKKIDFQKYDDSKV